MSFVFVYLACYGGMNAYLWWHVCQVLPAGVGWRLATGVWVAAMVLLPIWHAVYGTGIPEPAARALAWVLFVWMAWCLWFDAACLAVDAWNGLAWLTRGWLGEGRRLWVVPGRALVVIAGAWVVLASVAGWFEAARVRLRTVEVTSAKLPAGTPPVRLAVLADLHLGRTMRPGVVRQVLRLVGEAAPDAILSVGDLLDHPEERVRQSLPTLAALPAPLGRYGVIGNHEVYFGVDSSVAWHREAGFRVLRGEWLDVGPWLRLVGVDDPAVRMTGARPPPEDSLLESAASAERVVVLLRHQPTVLSGARRHADIQISGHVHGGQIFPFGWLVRLVYPMAPSRLHVHPEGLHLYVSRGSGTWGPPFRLGAPPEVTLVVIRPAAP